MCVTGWYYDSVIVWRYEYNSASVCTHDIEATQLVAAHDGDDSNQLPTDGRITEQTEERHRLLSVLHFNLSIHLLQFCTNILFSQKVLECWRQRDRERKKKPSSVYWVEVS